MASSATLTTTHLPRLRSILQEWEGAQPPPKGFTTPLDAIDASSASSEIRGKDVIVAFRTRPPLPDEAREKFTGAAEEAGESNEVSNDVVEFCSGISVASAEPGTFIAHVPGMKWNGPTLSQKKFDSDLAFGPDVKNDEVYKRAVAHNEVLPLVLSGGIGCILAYGQTGSGKTYTMEAIERHIADDLFKAAQSLAERFLKYNEGTNENELKGADVFEFSVTFLELLGKHAVDLVESSKEADANGEPIRKEVAIHEDKVGDVRPRLISTIVSSSEQLQELITSSLAHRRTSATARNATSSRSHALLTIRVKNKLLPYATEGQLILVDLAGSERYEDSKAHDKKRMDESRENNKSLMNLKECVRAKAKMANEDGFVHIPWRSNKLTMLLKPIFDIESSQPSKTIIIAHVSPHIQDTVHSVNTLGYAAPFKTSPPKPRGALPYDAKDPRTWTHAQTAAWLTAQFTKHARARQHAEWAVKNRHAELAGKKARPLDPDAPVQLAVDVERLCPPGMTATNFGRMYTTEFVQRCLDCRLAGVPVEADVCRNTAVETIGQLFYLILSAKTRKRNAIMKTRNKLSGTHYGDAPVIYAEGTNQALEVEEYDGIELFEARMALGNDRFERELADALSQASKEGKDRQHAYIRAEKALMDEFRALKLKEKEGEAEGGGKEAADAFKHL